MTAYDRAIDDLFAAFADCRPSNPVPYCTCGCNKKFAKDIERLPVADVKTLDRNLTDYLAGTLIWTVGDCTTLRFVLPRLLELSWNIPTSKGVFGRIAQCGFTDWSERERGAVLGFVDALWREWFENEAGNYLYGFDGELRDMSTAIQDDWQKRIHEFIASGSQASQLRLLWLVNNAMDAAPLVEWETIATWLRDPQIHQVLIDAMVREDLGAPYSEMQANLRNKAII